MKSVFKRALLALGWVGGILLAGCTKPMPDGAMVVTQTPAGSSAPVQNATVLDVRYPSGSRVVLVKPPYRPSDLAVLSKGLAAAGAVVVSPDGRRALFAGKSHAAGPWQIYRATFDNGRLERISFLPGGAMDPAVLPNGDALFSSPVPKAGQLWNSPTPPALYAQAPGKPARRLTFGTAPAIEPSVLADGRILFVSLSPGVVCGNEAPHMSLFTINSDGTELTTFGLDHDGAAMVRRPRELPDGRIAFLSADQQRSFSAEAVRKARPFASRAPLWAFSCGGCWSIEPDGERMLLACLDTRGFIGRSMAESVAVFRIGKDSRGVGEPLYLDARWNQVEAVPVARRPSPMGHPSAIMPEKKTGTILCLNANFTRNTGTPKAERVRVLAALDGGRSVTLGEVALQPDGSFMAEVPADVPLGFETLDRAGQVLQRLSPNLWVRPGENRSCIGCHEPYNRSPRNIRPLATTAVVPTLTNAAPWGERP